MFMIARIPDKVRTGNLRNVNLEFYRLTKLKILQNSYISSLYSFMLNFILTVTCTEVSMTKITGSRSDVWIY
jgi:hypothetical protein